MGITRTSLIRVLPLIDPGQCQNNKDSSKPGHCLEGILDARCTQASNAIGYANGAQDPLQGCDRLPYGECRDWNVW